CQFAEHVDFDAAIALLAVEFTRGRDSPYRYKRRLSDVERSHGGADAAEVELDADLLLLGLEGWEHCARIGECGANRFAHLQTFDIIRVERDIAPRLDQQGVSRTPD